MKESTMKQQHNPIQRQFRWQNQRRPSLRRARLQLEQLEDRTAPSVSVIGDFEGAASLNTYSTALRYAPSAVLLPIAAHDGLQGLVKQDGYEWMIREDGGSTVHVGDTVSVWTQFAGVADGRAYLGFDSHDIAPAHASLSTGGTLSVVMAANTNQLIIQRDAGGNGVASFNNVATAAQTYQADHWYRLEAQWGAGGAITAKLYDSDGTTLLSTVSGTTTAPFPSGGGIAFRALGHDKYFDTVVLDTGSTGSVDERANAGGGLDPSWVAGDPPAPVGNGPSGNPAPVPWAYTNSPGSGIEVRLDAFNGLQQVAIVGGTVGLAAANNSSITATKQVGWGDPIETPLLAQYVFRQRPGEATQLIGASSTKHVFSSGHSDTQHLNPGESDAYGAGTNADRNQYTYGSELDPVTGTLHSPIDRIGTTGSLSVDGIVNNGSRTFSSPIDLLLQVSGADLDPAQNPAGTKWYLMGNLFVGGEQDVTQASRWVEIVPHFNGTTFTFTYPSGAGGQLDFRTIPGLGVSSGFVVTASSPAGSLPGPVDHVHVVFSMSVDASTFTPAQVNFVDPSGAPITITSITDVGLADHTQFNINVDPQGIAGNYVLTLSSDILDLAGDHLNGQTGSDVVVNGGFENAVGSEWTGLGGQTYRDGGASPVRPEVPSHTGSWHLVLGTATVDADIRQTMATVPGQSYTFSFWFWSSGGNPTRDFHALWNGTELYAEINPDAHDYEQHTFTVTATGASTTIEFLARNDPAWDGLDDVSVVSTGAAAFTNRFTITSPAVSATTPGAGAVSAPFNQVRVTFDRPMDPATVTMANTTLTGPGGAIPVTIAAVGASTTQFDVTLDDQTAAGAYTLALSTGVQDTFANPITPFSRQYNILPTGTNLVTNGDFENPLGSEWTITDPSGQTFRDNGSGGSGVPSHSGSWHLALGRSGADAIIAQTLATVAGQSYTFSFWYWSSGQGPSDFHASWNGTEVYAVVNSPGHDYEQHTFTVTATGSSTAIQFLARNDPVWDGLDDISVIAN
jgi:Bacterial Ig-like domain